MRRNTLFLSFALILASTVALGADWPHVRGPELDGRTAAGGALDSASALEVAWKVPLGSGYSGVAIAGGRAVTLYSDGESDWAAAFDVANGKQVWRHKLGAAYKGHDGSDDGPLSSPAIGEGLVFAIDGQGGLSALRVADGTPAWTKQLVTDFGATAPDYGFSTSPIVEGRLVIVQAGGSNNRMLVALEAKSGTTVWTQGGDGLDYQSPTVMPLAGGRELVAVGKKSIVGLDPQTGKVLWTKEFPEGTRGGNTTPTFIDQDRFLVLMAGDARVFRVSRGGSGLEVAELYKSNALGGSYAHPVYYNGHLYGFRGQILTCINADTGERVWRSREPGGDGLILVDGKLVIFATKGNVVVADASPEGYKERARVQALPGSSLTWPSFADGRIFLRNLDALAAVKVRQGGGASAIARAESGSQFGKWIGQLESASDKKTMVDELFARHTTTPIVEGSFVHFVYRGEAKDVGVAGSMNETENPEPMRHVEGTDLHYRTYKLEPGVRWEYSFQVDYETWGQDPRNPRSVPPVEGEQALSEVATNGQAAPKFLEPPAGRRGRLDTFTLKSKALGVDKEVRVWVPPSYDAGQTSFPLLVVNDGKGWLDKGLLATALDNLVGGNRVAPVVVAFVPASPQWWFEAGGGRTDDYAKMLAEELIPELSQRYRLIDKPEARAVLGTRFYGFTTAYAAVERPEVFGKAAVQSTFLGMGHQDELAAMIRKRAGASATFYVDWNRYDERNVDRDWSFAADTRELADMLRKGGYRVEGGEVLDSFGWGGWRGRIDRVLVALFPAA